VHWAHCARKSIRAASNGGHLASRPSTASFVKSHGAADELGFRHGALDMRSPWRGPAWSPRSSTNRRGVHAVEPEAAAS